MNRETMHRVPVLRGGTATLSSILLATSLASCGVDSAIDDEWTTIADPPAMVVVTYPGDGEGAGDGAALEGTVSFEGGCLVIVGPADERTIPAAPEGQVVQNTVPVNLYGIELAEGDVVSFGGGWASSTTDFTIPSECANLGYGYFHSWTMEKK